MEKFTELLKLLGGYNQDMTIREVRGLISTFAELEQKNIELKQMYNLRNDDAIDYEKNIQKLEEKEEEKKEEIIVEKLPSKVVQENIRKSIGVDEDFYKEVEKEKSNRIEYKDFDKQKINELVERLNQEIDEDSLEDNGYDKDTLGEDDGLEEETKLYCEKCGNIINIIDEEEREYYYLFGMCKKCVEKINKKHK